MLTAPRLVQELPLAGALIIPRLSINLSALNTLQNVLPLSNNNRRVIDATVTPASATPLPSATPRPGVVERPCRVLPIVAV